MKFMCKKVIYILLCCVALSIHAYSKVVTKEQLESKLDDFAVYKGFIDSKVGKITQFNYNDIVALYVVNMQSGGWMLVSADDAVPPIVAYAKSGEYIVEGLPESVKFWMNGYAKQIYDVSKTNSRNMHPQWESLPAKISSATREDVVEPLIMVKFNQTTPWNKYCPSSTDGRAVVGCVAVAMAQAMTVPSYPERPTGAYSYYCAPYGNLSIDYSSEPLYSWNLIISGADNKDAAAKLLYQCGVSVRMGYSASGSGTQTSYVPNALKTYFKYPNAVKLYSRSESDEIWEDLIKNELFHGRAVIYSGNDGLGNPGHAFNLDGYDGNNMYHINWGWGGTNNGYYTINNVKDGTNDYTKNQQLIVGVRAPSVAPSDIFLSNVTVGENKPVGTIVGAITIDSEAVNPVYQYELKGAYSVLLHDYLESVFYVEDGYLRTKMSFSIEDQSVPVTIKVTNVETQQSYEKQFIIDIVESSTAVDDAVIENKILIYSENKIYLNCDCQTLSYGLYTLTGAKIYSSVLNKGVNYLYNLNVQKGYYLLKADGVLIKPMKILIN